MTKESESKKLFFLFVCSCIMSVFVIGIYSDICNYYSYRNTQYADWDFGPGNGEPKPLVDTLNAFSINQNAQ